MSFTSEELECLWTEWGMLRDAADAAMEEGRPRPDDAVIWRIYDKLCRYSNRDDAQRAVKETGQAKPQETLEEWRARQWAVIDKVMGWKRTP